MKRVHRRRLARRKAISLPSCDVLNKTVLNSTVSLSSFWFLWDCLDDCAPHVLTVPMYLRFLDLLALIKCSIYFAHVKHLTVKFVQSLSRGRPFSQWPLPILSRPLGRGPLPCPSPSFPRSSAFTCFVTPFPSLPPFSYGTLRTVGAHLHHLLRQRLRANALLSLSNKRAGPPHLPFRVFMHYRFMRVLIRVPHVSKAVWHLPHIGLEKSLILDRRDREAPPFSPSV